MILAIEVAPSIELTKEQQEFIKQGMHAIGSWFHELNTGDIYGLPLTYTGIFVDNADRSIYEVSTTLIKRPISHISNIPTDPTDREIAIGKKK